MGIIYDLDMTGYAYCAGERTISTDSGTTGNSTTGSNSGILTNDTIVSHMHMVINNYPFMQLSIPKRTAVYSCTGSYFNTVCNNNRAQLMDFTPTTIFFVRCKTKTIGSDHTPAMQNTVFANNNVMI